MTLREIQSFGRMMLARLAAMERKKAKAKAKAKAAAAKLAASKGM